LETREMHGCAWLICDFVRTHHRKISFEIIEKIVPKKYEKLHLKGIHE
jgi:hypothetical protein